MKLHLPLFLRKAILTLMLAYGVPALHAANLTLGAADSLSVDYSASGSLLDLDNGTLRLSGGTTLQLSSCGEGDGKTYILLTGVSELLDAQGNVISLDSTNNAASRYFDATRPGSGFWANGTLQLNHGALQLVLHNETVKAAITLTTRQENPSAYQYYAGISFEDISFSGGAIYGGFDSTITLSNNGSVRFNENTVSSTGGAIFASGGNILLNNNGSINFFGNTARYSAGAIYIGDSGAMSLNGNGFVIFSRNKVTGTNYCGGAIYGRDSSAITLSDNGRVVFEGNTADYGGAIYGRNSSSITLSDNSSVDFSGNTARYAGAIYGENASVISLNNNGSVTFSGNEASYAGGAIYGDNVTLSNNGSLTFSGNTASFYGGAIYGSTITLSNNGSVVFEGNTASSYGGAIYTYVGLSIRNNDSVEFYKNAEVDDGSYRLRSIYASGNEISLSAAAGKNIEFRDSIYIGYNSIFNLNEKYGDIDQNGDIIFTGRTTESDLYEVKGNVAGTEEETLLSRTSAVNTLTNLYGGRLRVEDGAIYQGQGITAHTGSAAMVRVQDATLSHEEYTLTFNSGTTLELAGANTITGIIQMQESSNLVFDLRDSQELTTVYGTMNLGGTLNVSVRGNVVGDNVFLLYVEDGISGWTEKTVNIDGKSLTLVYGDLLVGNYNADTFIPYVLGDYVLTDGLYGGCKLNYYDSIQGVGMGENCISGGTVELNHNGSINFRENVDRYSGGAIYVSDSGSISLNGNGTVIFSKNTVSSSGYCGGAIYGRDSSAITLSDNGSVVFEGNTADYGGAIYGRNSSSITLSDNSSVDFSGNTARYAGAIYGENASVISLNNNGSVEFSGNTAESASSTSSGGAIYGGSSSTTTLSNNGSVSFIGNTAESASSSSSTSSSSSSGGAIYGGSSSTTTLSNNGSVSFIGNTAESASSSSSTSSSSSSGGAIYGYGSTITLIDNGSVVFEGNTASASSSSDSSASGGAIYGYEDSTITLIDNGSVVFEGNTASASSSSSSSYYSSSARGGAIYGGSSSTITLSNNGSVTFSANTASAYSTYSSSAAAYGGAIYGSTITLNNNGGVVFEGNTASSSGGAIDGSTITLNNNGGVVFEGNTASSSGGAIDGSTITLSDNESVSFSGNTASSDGGAIYTYGDLSIRNNDSVEFYQNAEVNDGVYRLRSIYANAYGNEISLSAAAGKSIKFYDTVYIGTGATVNLNQDYTYQSEDGTSFTIKQQGDIVFTGAYAEQHLNDLLEAAGAGRTATAQEILNSRTTEVNAMTNLYGGRLRVEEGAIYQGRGITAMEGSGATVRVKDATLSHKGYTLTFNNGTTLELVGRNTITGTVQMQGGSSLAFDLGHGAEVSDIVGALEIGGAMTFELNFAKSGYESNEVLLYVSDSVTGWNPSDIIVPTGESLSWVDNLLVLNYQASTFEQFYNGSVSYNEQQYGDMLLHHYKEVNFDVAFHPDADGAIYGGNVTLNNNGSVTFRGNQSSPGRSIYGGSSGTITLNNNGSVTFCDNSASYGGAIYGDSSSTITLSDNGSVVFEGNTASSYGGAIYGDSSSTITLSDNGSVVFEGNTGSHSGGAIRGYSSTITLSDNESVSFSGNTVSYDGYCYGGAIYGDNIALCNNGSVEFLGNTASGYYVSGGAIYGDRAISLCNNGSVVFSGNMADSTSDEYSHGGAICTEALQIRNNDSVLFEKNVEKTGNVYRLRSIGINWSEKGTELSAAEGKSIEFRDSIYIASDSALKLNEKYGDVLQTGDIIFTGAYTESHLQEVKDGIAGTSEEIAKSRTTEVSSETLLYGGRLRVEDGAVFRGKSVTAVEGSGATIRVKDATLSLNNEWNQLYEDDASEESAIQGADLVFQSGTNLELVGASAIVGDVQMYNGSKLILTAGEATKLTSIVGNLELESGAVVSMALSAGGGTNHIALYLNGNRSGWHDNVFSVSGSGISASDFTWVDELLVFRYRPESFNRYFNGKKSVAETLHGMVNLHHHEQVEFKNLTSTVQGADGILAEGGGAAISAVDDTPVVLSYNKSVSFIENEVCTAVNSGGYGGAIRGVGEVLIDHNGEVEFSGNKCKVGEGGYWAEGGAIYGDEKVLLKNNSSLTFRNNAVIAESGSADNYVPVAGGAIYGGILSIIDNGKVEFSGNYIESTEENSYNEYYGGGALKIYSLSIQNNDSVLFEKNVEKLGGVYHLRSVDVGMYEEGAVLSAAEGKSIEFRDSVHISEYSDALELNSDFEGIRQQGDIIFTGKYTVGHLNEMLAADGAGRAATDEEILLSRTSEVNTMTNLYGGRLRVEEGAIYKGHGIIVAEGSGATVKVQNAVLSHSGYDLSFNAGTTLELVGNNVISGNLTLNGNSVLLFDSTDYKGDTALLGSLALDGGSVHVNSAENAENLILLASFENAEWNNVSLTWNGKVVDASNMMWVNHLLIFNYQEDTFAPYFNDAATLSKSLNTDAYYGNYLSYSNRYGISEGASSTAYGDERVLITNNGEVEFVGHLVYANDGGYAMGGAIQADAVKVDFNERVVFEGNNAFSAGGAIYAETVILSHNEEVIFRQNQSGAKAIYGENVELKDNGSVLFENNIGGAIAAGTGMDVSYNDSVVFKDNVSRDIYNGTWGWRTGAGALTGSLSMNHNKSEIVFSGNTYQLFASTTQGEMDHMIGGGAVGVPFANVQFSWSENDGSVSFTKNRAIAIGHLSGSYDDGYGATLWACLESEGGAILGSEGDTQLNNNKSGILFSGNLAFSSLSVQSEDDIVNADVVRATTCGGAVSLHIGTLDIQNNLGGVEFSENAVRSYARYEKHASCYAYGGAVGGSYWTYGDKMNGVNITVSNNDAVVFSRNSAWTNSGKSGGGAIYGNDFASINLNENGSLLFRENSVTTLELADSFSFARGGAIYILGNLSIRNNGSVLFEKNTECVEGAYRLRSVYVNSGYDTPSDRTVSLSAAEGNSIEFRDSIYISRGQVDFNADYGNEKQTGDIIFTGATTVADLYAAKGKLSGTEAEILASRTSEVNAITNLYRGRLCVESGAVYSGCGVMAHAGSAAVIRLSNASLLHSGYNITLNRGTGLELLGANSSSGHLMLEDGSRLTFHLDAGNMNQTLLTHTGSLTMGGTLGIQLLQQGTELPSGVYKLISVIDDSVTWDSEKLVVNGGSVAADALTWVDGTLCFNYSGELLPETVELSVSDAVDSSLSVTNQTRYIPDSATVNGAHINAGMELYLSSEGMVNLAGNVKPGAITVEGEGELILQGDADTPGSLAGSGRLTKNGTGTLVLNADNTGWSGDSYVNAGVLKVQGTASLGSGCVYLQGGTLDLNSMAVSNAVVQDGFAAVQNGELFAGSYLLKGGELLPGSSLNIAGTATLAGGMVNGSLYGPGEVMVTGHVIIGHTGQISTSDILIEESASLHTGGSGMVSPESAISLKRGAMLNLGGNLNVNQMSLDGGTIVSSFDLHVSGNLELSNDASVSLDADLSAGNLRVSDSVLRLLASENQKVKLQGNAEFSDSEVAVVGSFAAAGLSMVNTDFTLLNLPVQTEGSDSSYVSDIKSAVSISGGCLSLEDAVVLQGAGLSTVADSAAVVRLRNATMLHAGYTMSFGRGAKLDLRGVNTTSGNLNMASGSTLAFTFSSLNANAAILNHQGTLTLGAKLDIELSETGDYMASGYYKLLSVTEEVVGWNGCTVVINGGDIYSDSLTWIDDTLCFNYTGQDVPASPEEDLPGGDEPGGELPGGDEPGSNEPGGNLPGGDEPGSNEPGGNLPGGDEPGGELPGGDEPGSNEPGGNLPGGDEPGGELPGGDEPGSNEPGGNLPGGDEPGGELPGGDEPGSNEPGGNLPGGDEPGGELPGGDEPGSNEPGGNLPGGDEPGSNEPQNPDTPVTPDKPEPLKPLRPGAKPVLVGGDIDKNTEIILTEKGNVTLEGKVNAGAITVNCDKNITFKSTKKKPGSLAGSGDLTKKGKGTLTLNDGNTSWSGDTYLQAGTIKVKGTSSLGKGDVYVQGGTLNLGSKAIGNDIIQSKNATIKSGKKFTGTYTLESGELLKGSTLNISRKATLEGGTVNGTLTGTGTTTVTGNVKLGDKGKITTKALTLGADATLTTSAKGLSSKTTTLSIGEDATMVLGGKMTVDSLKINGGTLKTTASKPAAITVKNDMVLTDAVLTTNGKVTTNKLTLNESTMTIKGAKAQNLTVKQALTIGSGSALTLNGKLSAGSLTIKSGGSLTMSGSKPVTLKVKGALTLNEGSSIIMNYSFVQGKTYKVLTFGSYSGSKDYYSIFGVEADDCTITNTGKALTLTVTGKWKPQTQQKAVSADAAEPVVATKPQANPVADALVQSNWGQLEASRAFVNAMANRSMAVQLGNGERAVWASAIGSSSRHDTAGGHNGADTNVSGGAFGLETQVGRASLFGMALGNSWTRVSAHGFGTIEQDTTHLGIYGQTNWRSGVTADWSAAYGRSESESMGSEWNQKQLQLDGRVSYNHELNARTQLSPFAGVQYYASDAAGIGTTDTGSLQNLRAEIGVAASHRTGKLGVYGEIALHQDLARNNPSVSMEGARYTGMNPGRTGINFTIGASYELTDKWSVNASYTGEFVENANAHSANVGASYKF